jgi:type IV fimbrial biogenesis protein FimT
MRGFTLIELMVTVAVIAIFSTLAAPSFRQLIALQRVRTAASAITESLWIARSEAIKRNANVTFKVKKGSIVDWDVTESLDGTGPSLHHQEGFPSITSTTSSGADVLYTFNPYGRLSAGAGWIKLTAPNAASASRYVCVSTMGRAAVQEASC